MVVSDALEFLRQRGHRVDELTDYEIEETFVAAFKNWEHGLVEAAFYIGLPWVTKPKDWKKYCDDIHNAIEGRPEQPDAGQELLAGFLGQGIHVAN